MVEYMKKSDEGKINTYIGKFINVYEDIETEEDIIISELNKEWLYPKLDNFVGALINTMRGDPGLAFQVNSLLNELAEKMQKLIKISEEEFKKKLKE